MALKRWTGPVDTGPFGFHPAGSAAVRFIRETTEPNVPGQEGETLTRVITYSRGRRVEKTYPGIDVDRV